MIALKLDMSKVYDKIEWPFLELVLRVLGFTSQWVSLIMSCVTMFNYKVFVNGRPEKTITPTKGLCQGNPISPFLFIMCTEELSYMLNRANQQKKIQGAYVKRGGTHINHFLFADDCILYSKAAKDDWDMIHEILTF